MKRHTSKANDPRRQQLAHEIARIMWEYRIEDFKQAKDKAARRMGLRHADLPDNREITRALDAYVELFAAEDKHIRRGLLLNLAHELMVKLADFKPRLVGLEPQALITPETGLRLHLFADQAESVELLFQKSGIEYQLDDRRFRFGYEDYETRPTYEFVYEGEQIHASVFATVARSRIPLSPVDGKPMRRLSLREVDEMLRVLG